MSIVIGFIIASIISNTQIKTVELRDPFYVEPVVEEVQVAEFEPDYYTLDAKITYYCSCSKCCGKSDGVTSSGSKAQVGHTIAAPKSYAFGTQIEIDGVVYTVEDRGGSISGNRFDVYVGSHQEALNLGVKYAEVKIYQ